MITPVSLLLAFAAALAPPPAGCQEPTGRGAVVIMPAQPALQTSTGRVQSGDTVALFSPSGQCVGSVTLEGAAVALVAWADDPSTAEVDGFSEGDALEFRVYTSAGTESDSQEVTATYQEGYGASRGLLSGAVYVVEESNSGESMPWISELNAVGSDPYVEIAGVGPQPLWLAGLDDAGTVEWALDLSGRPQSDDGLVLVQASEIEGSTSALLGLADSPRAVALLTGDQPQVGVSAYGMSVEDAVVFGAPSAPRKEALLAATGETVQYVATESLSRMARGGLLFPAPLTPTATNAAPAVTGGPDMAIPVGGHHLISFPVLSASSEALKVEDLGALGPLVGVPGSHEPDADPNVWTGFDGSGGFQAPSSVDMPLPPGRGVLWSWPSVAEGRTGSASKLSVEGAPIDDVVTGGAHTVTFSEPSSDGLYLVGNPYAYPLSVDGLSVESGTLQSSVAVWDSEQETFVDLFAGDTTGVGSIPVWAGAVAEVSGPVQGVVTFSSTSAHVDPTAQPLDARQPDSSRLSLTLSGTLDSGREVVDHSAHVWFVDGAEPEWDRHDASKLSSPTDAHALVAFVGERDGHPQRQRVLSMPPGSAPSVSIAFTSTHKGAFSLAWSGGDALEGLELVDHETGAAVALAAAAEYTFTASGPTVWSDRFEIRPVLSGPLSTGTTPDQLAVGVPYPNPVVRTTTVHVEAVSPADVTADVFDTLGRRVTTADIVPAAAGADVRVDAADLAAGLYVVMIRVGEATSTRQFVVAR